MRLGGWLCACAATGNRDASAPPQAIPITPRTLLRVVDFMTSLLFLTSPMVHASARSESAANGNVALPADNSRYRDLGPELQLQTRVRPYVPDVRSSISPDLLPGVRSA